MSKPFSQCPVCGSDVKFYNTAPDGNRGRYKCQSCGRDTTWAQGKVRTFDEVMESLDKRIAQKVKEES